MKKFSKLLLLLLILPLSVSFSACKKGGGSPNSNPNQEERPNPGNPDDNYGSQVQTYSVSYDYNLPEDYDFLLEGKDFVLPYKEVGTPTVLAKVPDVSLQSYFLGWCKDGSNEVLSGSVTSDVATTINLKGKWDETSLRKYYYTEGLQIDIIAEKASIYGYTGTSQTIIIPKVFSDTNADYELTEIQASVFQNKNVSTIINNAENLKIGECAFKNTKVSTFDFDKIYEIGNYAFENTKFESLKLGNNVSLFGTGAFQNCLDLTSVDFEENDVQISNNMFSGCEKLTTITNTLNVTRIGGNAFAECISLKNTNFISARVSVIEEYAFKNCVGLTSVTLPETLNFVYESIFAGCETITELRLGKTFENENNENRSDTLLQHIGNIGANVTKIELIGNSITRLSRNYFNGFSKLETFVMSDSVTLIEPYAFKNCSLLKNIDLSNKLDLDSLSYLAFKDTKYLNDLNIPLIYENEVLHEARIIYVPENITPEYKFPGSPVITQINDSAFAGNESLQKITIPSSVLAIGKNVFKNCVNLKEVIFEENSNIKIINESTFYGCSSLTSINLTNLNALESIANNAFAKVKVSNFALPDSLKTIGKSVFLDAEIAEFSINGESEKIVVEDGVLYSVEESKKTLVCYPGLKQDKMFVCPNDVTEIDAYAFSNVSDTTLKYIYFSNEVDWVVTRNGDGAKVYTSFNGVTGKVIVFASDVDFVINESVVTYRQYIFGISYDFETDEVLFSLDFTCNYDLIYFTAYDSSTQKNYFIYLELKKEIGEDDVVTYLVKEDSLFKLEVEF